MSHTEHTAGGRWTGSASHAFGPFRLPAVACAAAILLIAAAMGLAAHPVAAASAVQSTVQRLDSGLDEFLAADAQLTTVYTERDGFFEGPAWVGGRNGFAIFSDIPGNRVMKVDQHGRVSVLIDKVQRLPTPNAIHDTLYTLRDLVGPNGTLPIDAHEIVVTQFGGLTLEEINWKTGARRILASGATEPRFRLPNDLARAPNGDIFFTAEGGLFRLRNGEVTRIRQMSTNGIAFGPAHSFLYVTEGLSLIRKISLRADGTAGEVSTFIDTKGDPEKGEFVDGLKVDTAGNLWAVAPGGVWIMSPDAKVLGHIAAPSVSSPTGTHKRFTNLAFGGRAGATLYLTAPGGVYSLPLKRSAIALP